MGFFGRLFGKGDARAPEEPPPAAPAARPPDGVIVLREGMRVPESAYVLAVAAVAFEGGAVPESLPHVGLSQPRWFRPGGEFTQAGVADAVQACLARLELPGDARARHRETHGPDGARVMLIELRRP